MEEQVVEYGLKHRQESRNNIFFTRSDIMSIVGRLQASSGRPPVAAAPTARLQRQQRRGAGGARPVASPVLQDPPKDFSDKVIQEFKLETTIDNERILLRNVPRNGQRRWVPLTALEDLPALLKAHNERALLYKCARKLYDHLRNNAPTKLSAHPDGTSRLVHGLEGFDRKVVGIYLKGCIVRNDQAPTKPLYQ